MIKVSTIKEFSHNDLITLLEAVYLTAELNNDDDIQILYSKLNQIANFNFSICCSFKLLESNHIQIVNTININYPIDWIELYTSRNYHKIDPIFKSHISTFQPQIWAHTYRKVNNTTNGFINKSKQFGLLNGFTHGFYERHLAKGSIISFAYNNNINLDKKDYNILCFIVPHIHNFIIRCSNKTEGIRNEESTIGLTTREIEVLNWIKEGKTNWEISVILSISERTVKYHVNNLLIKLNATNRSHAIAKAFKINAISF